MSVTVTLPMAPSDNVVSERLRKRATRHVKERIIEAVLLGAALVSVFTTLAIVYILVSESWVFFQHVPLKDFLFDTQWTPLFDDAHYGIMVLLSGTITSSAVALLVAIPLGTIIAIYLSEFAPFKVREIAKPFLELLGGVPTIIYGYFALVFLTPLLQMIYPDLPGFNLLSAGIVMGIMIIPYVASLSEDAMRAVPSALREGAYGLGSNRFQVSTRVVVPAAISGIIASFVLGVSRAIGETTIVLLAAGQMARASFWPGESVLTMTAFIAGTGSGDVPTGSIEYKTIFAVGLTLFVITFALNIFAIRMVRRFREVYE